ncbi:hypothetical protein ACH518_11410 [Methylomonas sp. HW2-6]|uniref:hypothetical protein n=1 Tax=Methylomonas sp. HW2-6 TaxID=3376687 RepID=UPI004041A888
MPGSNPRPPDPAEVAAQSRERELAAALLAGTDLVLTVASRADVGSALPANLIMLEPPLPISPSDSAAIWRTGLEANPELAWLRGEIRAVGR